MSVNLANALSYELWGHPSRGSSTIGEGTIFIVTVSITFIWGLCASQSSTSNDQRAQSFACFAGQRFRHGYS